MTSSNSDVSQIIYHSEHIAYPVIVPYILSQYTHIHLCEQILKLLIHTAYEPKPRKQMIDMHKTIYQKYTI